MIPPPNETTFNEINTLRGKLHSVQLPQDLLDKTSMMLDRTQAAIKFNGYYPGIDQVYNYIDLITSLPWFTRSQDTIDIPTVSSILDRNHFGLKGVKDRILEYTAVLKLSKAFTDQANAKVDWSMRAPILLLVGLVGVGKTTLAISIAEAMGRKFIRLPFGGLGSAMELRGQSRVHADAEPGLIVKALRRAGTKNPVILFDEVDRVTDEARADIMGVLVELMDPQQNNAFTDHYLDYPLDLSEVLFIATANKTGGIAQAVLDRFEPIAMPVYNDVEKTTIAKQYLLPKVIAACGLQPNQIIFDDAAWPSIIRPIGYDAGMRTLERTLIGICRKVARLVVEGQTQTIVITAQNAKEFIHSDTNLY
ncbi:MAG TPA: AAA family ATPase [Candidatus Saccharimonadales bacterium]|nr:AAA family ATPase [Candidatus Saccharimonadales bacterium]